MAFEESSVLGVIGAVAVLMVTVSLLVSASGYGYATAWPTRSTTR